MTYPGRIPNATRIGMSAALADFDARLKETGSVDAQRIFCAPITDDESAYVKTASAAGRLCVVSFKVPNNDWTGATAGKYDSQFKAAFAALSNVGSPVVVAVHHEPSGNGAAADWAAMQQHVVPIIKSYPNLAAAVIGNGFWWGAKGGLSDADLASYFPPALLKVVDVVAADFYQSDRNLTSDLLQRFADWAGRVGVKELGIGELGTYTSDELLSAAATLAKHADLFGWVNYFNSPRNSRADWVLSGDRLTAFQKIVADARAVAASLADPTIALKSQIASLNEDLAAAEAEINDLHREIDNLNEDLAAAKADNAAALSAAKATVAALGG